MNLISLLFADPLAFMVVAGALVASLTIHEFAHAWVADKLGDPTPRIQDRVTLNPLAHLDPLGTAALLFIGFGWGKPVQFDPYNLKDQVRDTALIALAGPASNLLLAVAAVAVNLIIPLPTEIFFALVYFNVLLMVFNLVPVAPLDGSKIITALLPRETAYEYESLMNRYGMWILLFLLLPWNGRSVIGSFISPIIGSVTSLLLGF